MAQLMIPRILSYLVFAILMTVIIIGSILVVTVLYLPYVVAKAIFMAVSGKLNPKPDSESLAPSGEG